MNTPGIIAFAGLSGTGKTTLANRLAPLLDAAVLSKDQLRAAIFAPNQVSYTQEQDDSVMEIIYQLTAALLAQGRRVILDGRTFINPAARDRLAQFAANLPVSLFWIECVCSEETARQRLEQDRRTGRHPARNRGYGLYLRARAQAVPMTEARLTVNTDLDLEQCLQACLAYIREGETRSD